MDAKAVTTELIADTDIFGEAPVRHRLGLVALSTDVTIEGDFHPHAAGTVRFSIPRGSR